MPHEGVSVQVRKRPDEIVWSDPTIYTPEQIESWYAETLEELEADKPE